MNIRETKSVHLAFATAFFAIGCLGLAPSFAADVYEIDTAHSGVGFQVRHLVTKVRGSFDTFEGSIEMDSEEPANSSVEFTIDAASVNTANERRDNHLRSADFFDVENHPQITFASTSVEATGEGTFDVTGVLTMRGIEKEITLPVTFLGEMAFMGGVRAGFETAVTVDRKDWQINFNRALDQGGTILGDEVSIEINLEVIKHEEEAEEDEMEAAE